MKTTIVGGIAPESMSVSRAAFTFVAPSHRWYPVGAS
jgi:hypothetical protein